MEELNLASAREIQHFSHSHILQLTTFQGGRASESCCRGCVRPIGEGLAYHCQPCNFVLHLSCSQIPQQITHRACEHGLHLLSQPWDYPPPLVSRCNACCQPITQGFSFHCSICQLDLHPSCANLPMEYNHPHHTRHKLYLLFIPPYTTRTFICNVCNLGGDSWHYHCSECHYDAHVNCTQIPSFREYLLNETSRAIGRAYVNDGGGRMGRGHLERGFGEHQMQRLPFQDPHNTRGYVFARPVIGAIMRTVLGSIIQSFMIPFGGGGKGGGGVLEGLNGFGDNFSDVIGSLFSFGFF